MSAVSKANKCEDKNKIQALLYRIRNLNLISTIDIDEIKSISELLHSEWKIIKSKYRQKLIRKKLYSEKLYAEQKAEEEMIFGLMDLLTDTMASYVTASHQSKA